MDPRSLDSGRRRNWFAVRVEGRPIRAGPRALGTGHALAADRVEAYTICVGFPLLPLFPLPLVLFPGTPLPLHIFEPRYRRMLADCLRGDRRFGILFQPDDAETDLPAPGTVGCVAHVDTCADRPDGRSDILVSGVARFELQRLVSGDEPYLVGAVTMYDDLAEPSIPLETLARQVRDLFARVGRAAGVIADDRATPPELPRDAALLSFAIASLVDLDAPARQALLASRSPMDRLRSVETLLASAVDTIESHAHVHRRAKRNGHGPHPVA